jgi:hypothetical protein
VGTAPFQTLYLRTSYPDHEIGHLNGSLLGQPRLAGLAVRQGPPKLCAMCATLGGGGEEV